MASDSSARDWWPTSAAAACVAFALTSSPTMVQEAEVEGPGDVRAAADAILRLQGYSAVPDNTVGSLSIDSTGDDTAVLRLFKTGGSWTVSDSFPLYMEGFLGASRFDPKFVFSQGDSERVVPARWNSFTATGGLGWDIDVAENLVLRPIANISLGYVASDLTVARAVIDRDIDAEFDFLDDGQLFTFGYGGSAILDYERHRPEWELDAELRYTFLRLQSLPGSSDGVSGSADAQSADLWVRYRWPTGLQVLDRPLRYVLQGAHTTFIGDQADALDFNYLTKLGAGIEVETTDVLWLITRVRLVGSFAFGANVTGATLGFAASW